MTTGTLSPHAIQDSRNRTQAERNEKQYSISGILTIWALASIPGGLRFWLGLPLLDRYTEISTGYLVLGTLVTSYVWHLILAFLVLKLEAA